MRRTVETNVLQGDTDRVSPLPLPLHSADMCTVRQCAQCDIIHSAGMPTVRQCAQYVLLALHIAAMQNHSQTGICSDAQKSRQKVALAKRCYFCKMLNFLLAKGEEEFYQLLFRTLHLKGKRFKKSNKFKTCQKDRKLLAENRWSGMCQGK